MTNQELTNALYERGFDNVTEYIDSLADENGVDSDTVQALYSMMPEDLFDGLVTTLEDIGNGY